MIEKMTAWIIGTIAVVAALIGVWINNQPVDVQVRLNETSVHNDNLPPLENAIVSISLDNETKTDTIHSMNASALFANIPHRAIGKEAHVSVSCQNWLATDTTVTLSKNVTVNIARDPKPYGDIQFKLWNVTTEKYYTNTIVFINGHEAMSDDEGKIKYSMPLVEQDTLYVIKTSLPLVSDTFYVPTTESSIIQVK